MNVFETNAGFSYVEVLMDSIRDIAMEKRTQNELAKERNELLANISQSLAEISRNTGQTANKNTTTKADAKKQNAE